MSKSDYKNYSDLTLDEVEQLVQELEIMSIKALKERKKNPETADIEIRESGHE